MKEKAPLTLNEGLTTMLETVASISNHSGKTSSISELPQSAVEVWKLERNFICIYTEDPFYARKLSRTPFAGWFGTYFKGGRWAGEQYRVAKKDYQKIARLVPLPKIDFCAAQRKGGQIRAKMKDFSMARSKGLAKIHPDM